MSDYYDPANIYLENDVLTASPQRLRLMLINAALRHSQQVVAAWQQEELDVGRQSLVRAQAIVSELQTSIRGDASPLAQQVAALYVVLYCNLVEAQLDNDIARVEGVILALLEEQQTWQLLCAASDSSASDSNDHASNQSPETPILHDAHVADESSFAPHFHADVLSSEGLSLEA